jgi:hypothetical protein
MALHAKAKAEAGDRFRCEGARLWVRCENEVPNTHGQFTAGVLRPPNKSRCESVLSLGATSSKGGSMMRKTTIALFALAAVGLAQPTAAFARGGGGGGGGHGGGGGGHGGGMGGGGFRGGGFGGGGGFRGGGFHSSAALGGGGFRGGGFHGGFASGGFHGGGFHRGGFHRRAFVGFGLGSYGYYDGYYPYAYNDDYYDDGGCYVVRRRVHTRYGWRVQRVEVCG